MASDTDELRAALEKTRAELATVTARADELNAELDASPELVLSVEQLEGELRAARDRESQLVDAVKRARADRAAFAAPAPVEQPEAAAEPTDLAVLPPALNEMRRPTRAPVSRLFIALGMSATGLAATVFKDPMLLFAGLAAVLVLAFVFRSRE